jgi:hypothetical protein
MSPHPAAAADLSCVAGKVKADINDPITLAAALCRSRALADLLPRWIGHINLSDNSDLDKSPDRELI